MIIITVATLIRRVDAPRLAAHRALNTPSRVPPEVAPLAAVHPVDAHRLRARQWPARRSTGHPQACAKAPA